MIGRVSPEKAHLDGRQSPYDNFGLRRKYVTYYKQQSGLSGGLLVHFLLDRIDSRQVLLQHRQRLLRESHNRRIFPHGYILLE